MPGSGVSISAMGRLLAFTKNSFLFFAKIWFHGLNLCAKSKDAALILKVALKHIAKQLEWDLGALVFWNVAKKVQNSAAVRIFFGSF